MLSIYGVDLNTLLLIAPSAAIVTRFYKYYHNKKELKDRYSLLNGKPLYTTR
jgi:hypothetical protein